MPAPNRRTPTIHLIVTREYAGTPSTAIICGGRAPRRKIDTRDIGQVTCRSCLKSHATITAPGFKARPLAPHAHLVTPGLVVCAPAPPGTLPHVATATRDVCGNCGGPIWIAPSTRSFMAEHPNRGFLTLCIPCVLHNIQEDGEAPELVPPTTEQIAEIAAHFGQNN